MWLRSGVHILCSLVIVRASSSDILSTRQENFVDVTTIRTSSWYMDQFSWYMATWINVPLLSANQKRTFFRVATNVHYAVKAIEFEGNEFDRKEAIKEAKLLSSLTHQHVLKFVEYFEDEDCLHLVTEYCEGGDVHHYIQARKGRPIGEKTILMWLYQSACGLNYLHEQKVLHRDIKTKNMFLMADFSLKLGDMGIAKVLDASQSKADTFVGTLAYMAPELIEHASYNYKADMWSLGCCVYEMAALERAFPSSSMLTIVMKISRGEAPDFPSLYSGFLASLVKALFSINPKERPNTNEILKEPHVQQARSWRMEEIVEPMQYNQKDNDENDGDKTLTPSGKSRGKSQIKDYRKLSTSWSVLKEDISRSQRQKLLKNFSRSRDESDSGSYSSFLNGGTFVDHEAENCNDSDDNTFVVHSSAEGDEKRHLKYSNTRKDSDQNDAEDLNQTFVISTVDSDCQKQPIGEIDLSKNPISMAREFMNSIRKTVTSKSKKATPLKEIEVKEYKKPKPKKKKKKLLSKIAEKQKQDSIDGETVTLRRENIVHGSQFSPAQSLNTTYTISGNSCASGSDQVVHRSKDSGRHYVPFDQRKTTDSIRGIMALMADPNNRSLCTEQAAILQQEISDDLGQSVLKDLYSVMGCIQDDNILNVVIQDMIGEKKFEEYRMHLFILRMYELTTMTTDC